METQKSLVALVHEASNIEQMLIQAEGETTPEIDNALEVNQAELAEKLDGYAYIMDRLKALETHYKELADFYKEVSTKCKNANKRLNDNIKYAMEKMGTPELAGTNFRFTIAATAGTLNILDEEMIPVEYKKEVTSTAIDKEAIKEALAAGKEVEGAELVAGISLRKYANTVDKKKKKNEVANV